MQAEIANPAPVAAPAPTIAERLRFQFQFALLMLSCDRIEEAQAAFRTGFELLEELDA